MTFEQFLVVERAARESEDDVTMRLCAEFRRQRALIHRLEKLIGMKRDQAMAEMMEGMK